MLIEFSEFNFKLILFLIYPISIRIQDYSNEAYIKEDKDNILFTIFRCYLSFIFSGVPLLILIFLLINTFLSPQILKI